MARPFKMRYSLCVSPIIATCCRDLHDYNLDTMIDGKTNNNLESCCRLSVRPLALFSCFILFLQKYIIHEFSGGVSTSTDLISHQKDSTGLI